MDPSQVTGTVLTPATPINGGPVPVLDPATGEVTVPPGTPAGDYTITYQICESLNPNNCDTATVTITVTAPALEANDDTFGPVAGGSGGSAGNVYENDTLNGQPVDPSQVTGTVLTPATPIDGGPVPVLDPTTGEVTVSPGTPAGSYTITYQICEILNPTNCDTATVTIEVVAPGSMRVTKSAQPRDVKPGDLVRYTLVVENTGNTPVVDATLVDTPPAGFNYVDGSLSVADRDGVGRLVSTHPLSVDQIDIAVGGRATIVYLMRVGAGVRHGVHVNRAYMIDDGLIGSNVGTAEVQVLGDPMTEESTIVGTVWDDRNGDGFQQEDEPGIPGVRVASVEGLLIETDQYGRYHLAGLPLPVNDRGSNVILKVDPATLPPGSEFTTDNPLLRRVTPGLPVRFDFGVKLPPGEIEGGIEAVELELGEVLFAPGSAQVESRFQPVIDGIAERVRGRPDAEVIIAANGENEALALERAGNVQRALTGVLGADASAVRVSLRADPANPDTHLVTVGDAPVLGTFLFDTDRSTIKPQYAQLVRDVAAEIERRASQGPLVVALVGHADRRASDEYNRRLGMRRATAVQQALAAAMSPEARARLRVDYRDELNAPTGLPDAGQGGRK
ncbi:OmpA family protein [Luteimonas sp. e5]